MKPIDNLVEIDINLMQDIVPFILVADADLIITYASKAISNRIDGVLGRKLPQVVSFATSLEAVSTQSISEIIGTPSKLNLLCDKISLPLSGCWLASHPGFILMAIPNIMEKEDVSSFSLDDFSLNGPFLDLYMIVGNYVTYLKNASSEIEALERKNEEIAVAKRRLERANVDLHAEIQRRKKVEGEIQRNYESQIILNNILQISLKDCSLEDMLEQFIREIASIPWTALGSKGAIFLIEKKTKTLKLVAHCNLDPPLQEKCAQIPLGKCLCGKAAQSREIIFSECIDKQHEVSYPGMLPHGHYCVPIISSGDKEILGVFNLYLKEGHRLNELEEGFLLWAIVNVLAGIIKRKQAETALSESEAQHREVFEVATDTFFIIDLTGKIVEVNPSVSKMYGYRREEVLGMSSDNLVHPDYHHSFAEFKKRIQAKGHHFTESVHLRKNGTDMAVEIRGTTLTFKGTPHLLAIARDITERKRAETELQKEHMHKERLLVALPSILIGVDENDKVTQWNTTAEETFGIAATKIIGKTLVKCGIKWNWEEILPHIKDCRIQDQPVRIDEIHFQNSQGKDRFVGITINSLKDNTGDYCGFFLLGRDITKQKILGAQLIQAQKLESIGQLAAGIAHEINTPMQYVSDNTRFLQDSFNDLNMLLTKHVDLLKKVEKNQDAKPIVKEIIAAAEETDQEFLVVEIPKAISQSLEGINRVSKIVRAMKEFSHPGQEEKTPVDINRAIENTLTVARNEWKYVAEMITDFSPALPFVPCFVGEFNQVILNIVVNSAHAIAERKGNTPGSKGKIKISTRRDDSWVEVRIADSGTGIPPEVQPRVFDPFFTTKEVGKGTGQGLALSHAVIVEKHQGTLTFETEVGKGTTFIIRLPLLVTGPGREIS